MNPSQPEFSMSPTEARMRVIGYDLAYAMFLLFGLGALLGASWEALRTLNWWVLPLSLLGLVPGALYGAHLGRVSARRLAEDPYDEWAYAWVTLHYAGPWAPLSWLICRLRRVPSWPQRPDWGGRRYLQAARLHTALAWELIAIAVYVVWAAGVGILMTPPAQRFDLCLWLGLGLVLPLAALVVADLLALLAALRKQGDAPSEA